MMTYSYIDKQNIIDNIYRTRIKLINRLNIDYTKSVKMYIYFMDAWMSRIFN